MEPSPNLQAKLADIQRDYAAQLSNRLEQLGQSWQAVVDSEWEEACLRELRMQLHKLAGSGAMFGYERMSRHARALEVMLDSQLDAPEGDLAPLQAQGLMQLELIRQAALDTPATRHQVGHSEPVPSSHTLYLIGEDKAVAAQLAPQFQHYGLHFVHLSDPAELPERIGREPAVALLVEAPLLEQVSAELPAQRPPLLCLSAQGDLASRLFAVRHGARAFLPLPLDLDQLLERLDSLNRPTDRRPYRVMLITASAALGAFYRQLLSGDGMSLQLHHSADGSLEQLSDFQPELILLDTALPDADGRLLGEVIRQHDTFIGIPILFLSNSDESTITSRNNYHSGDKLLLKPLDGEALTQAVHHRVERARLVRSQLRHDGLTGLLNHSATSEALSAELKRAKRHQMPLTYVMLDLDHFKKVNDYHGHAAGDLVLRNLARLLRQRLRGSDIIGRYGGEEFVIGLTNSDAEVAASVINELRRDFAALLHQGEPEPFHVTFSAGVALSTEFDHLAPLGEAADRALYAAKHAGRNRVMIAHPDSEPTDITRDT